MNQYHLHVVWNWLFISHEYLECEPHPVEGSRFPNELNCKLMVRFQGDTRPVFEFKLDLLIHNSDNMASTLPSHLAVVVLIQKFKLITRDKPNVVFVWKDKEGHYLLVEVVIKPDLDVPLSLRFFETFVVIGFQSNQRLKDIFVLSRVLIPQQNGLHSSLLLFLFVSQVSYLGQGFLFPEIFKLINFLGSNLSGALELNVRRVLNKPVKDCLVFNQGLPVFHIPLTILYR